MKYWLCSIILFLASMSGSRTLAEMTGHVAFKAQEEQIVFEHNASVINASLGNPTSVLEYTPMRSYWVEFGMSYRGQERDDFWFDVLVDLPVAGKGTFADRDYFAEQVLFSSTESNARSPDGYGLHLRIPVPFSSSSTLGGFSLRSYLTGRFKDISYAATGIDTIVGTSSSMVSPSETVIKHEIEELQAGMGVEMRRKLNEKGGKLTFRGEIVGAVTEVEDSHFLRDDLGPLPNIRYKFEGWGGYVEADISLPVTEKIRASIGLFGGIIRGQGDIIFGASQPGPQNIFPADYRHIHKGIRLNLSAVF